MNSFSYADVSCAVCGHRGLSVFYENPAAPVFCNVLWSDRSSAIASPQASIRLGVCSRCGMISNVDFRPEFLKYSPNYENSLHYSGRFQKYAEDLACRLVKRYQLYHKTVIEIGCGQGDFLLLLAGAGGNRAIGFDPSYNPALASAYTKQRVTIRPELFSHSHADVAADMICCRQVLEHIANPIEFLREIRQVIGERKDTIVFFEVPNALYTLRDKGIWDIIYEHCSYFTVRSLSTLFELTGFEVIEVSEQYGGQFITLEARPGGASKTTLESDEHAQSLLVSFQTMYQGKTGFWSRLMDDQVRRNYRTVIWGAGSKGITFLNTLHLSHEKLEYVVDVNPRKHGRFITGTGQQIIPPVFLQQYNPQAVILMNPIYQEEIRRTMQRLNLSAETLLA